MSCQKRVFRLLLALAAFVAIHGQNDALVDSFYGMMLPEMEKDNANVGPSVPLPINTSPSGPSHLVAGQQYFYGLGLVNLQADAAPPATASPSASPTSSPTASPTTLPTASPTASPTSIPTTPPMEASMAPTSAPTAPVQLEANTTAPTSYSTDAPTAAASEVTDAPTASPAPPDAPPPASSVSPSSLPTAARATRTPTKPGESFAPTSSPTTQTPTALGETFTPTKAPTSAMPTVSPTVSPSRAPTLAPTHAPTAPPTTFAPTAPTASPSTSPSASPTVAPTASPTESPSTVSPTPSPTSSPSTAPTFCKIDCPEGQRPGIGDAESCRCVDAVQFQLFLKMNIEDVDPDLLRSSLESSLEVGYDQFSVTLTAGSTIADIVVVPAAGESAIDPALASKILNMLEGSISGTYCSASTCELNLDDALGEFTVRYVLAPNYKPSPPAAAPRLSPPAPPDDNGGGGSDLSLGAILGIAGGCGAVLFCLLGGGYFLWRSRHTYEVEPSSEYVPTSPFRKIASRISHAASLPRMKHSTFRWPGWMRTWGGHKKGIYTNANDGEAEPTSDMEMPINAKPMRDLEVSTSSGVGLAHAHRYEESSSPIPPPRAPGDLPPVRPPSRVGQALGGMQSSADLRPMQQHAARNPAMLLAPLPQPGALHDGRAPTSPDSTGRSPTQAPTMLPGYGPGSVQSPVGEFPQGSRHAVTLPPPPSHNLHDNTSGPQPWSATESAWSAALPSSSLGPDDRM